MAVLRVLVVSVVEGGGRESGGDRMEGWREGCGSTFDLDLGS